MTGISRAESSIVTKIFVKFRKKHNPDVIPYDDYYDFVFKHPSDRYYWKSRVRNRSATQI